MAVHIPADRIKRVDINVRVPAARVLGEEWPVTYSFRDIPKAKNGHVHLFGVKSLVCTVDYCKERSPLQILRNDKRRAWITRMMREQREQIAVQFLAAEDEVAPYNMLNAHLARVNYAA